MKDKIVSEERLAEIVKGLKSQGKRVVSTSGCFDILHAGHVEYLWAAKQKGDVLVIMLNTDASVRGLKGEERPIVPENERAVVLSALESVDYVCMFEDRTPCRLIEKVKPDVVVKGGDYKGKHIPEMDSVSKYGGSVEYVLLVDGLSTTNIVNKITSIAKK